MVDGKEVEQGLVLYLAGEGHSGLRRRMKAWQISRGMKSRDVRFLHLSRQTISFSGEGTQAVIGEAQALSKFHGAPIALIVIDTLARHIEGDENQTKDMSAFVKAVDSLRTPFPGCVCVIVHHTGHSDDARTRSRGSSALRAAMDFEVHCDKGTLTFTKMKDSEVPAPILFKLRQVPIGQNAHGETFSSCIIEYGTRADHQDAELTINEQLALKAFLKASIAADTDSNGNQAVLDADWREAFYVLRRGDDPDAKAHTLRVAFLRASNGLITKRIITEDGSLRVLSKGSLCAVRSHVTDRHDTSQMTVETERHTSHTLYRGCDDVTGSCDTVGYIQDPDEQERLWDTA